MQSLGTIGPHDLLKMIEGRSDTEIITRFTELGVESALDRVFQGMVEAFLPERAGKDSAVIQWDLMTPDGPRTYQLVVENGKCSWNRDALGKARVSLKIAVPDFLRLITGKLGGLQAFFQGKLKVGGDVLFAQQQEKWFQKPS